MEKIRSWEIKGLQEERRITIEETYPRWDKTPTIKFVRTSKWGKDNNDVKEEVRRGKHQYIASIAGGQNFDTFITGGFPCLKTSSKGIVKRNIVKLMVVDKKKETTFEE